jgi:hypothetical protein
MGRKWEGARGRPDSNTIKDCGSTFNLAPRQWYAANWLSGRAVTTSINTLSRN